MIENKDALGRVMPPILRDFPRTIFLSHWFPLSSETFVFYEIEGLYKRDLPISVISLYAKNHKDYYCYPILILFPFPIYRVKFHQML